MIKINHQSKSIEETLSFLPKGDYQYLESILNDILIKLNEHDLSDKSDLLTLKKVNYCILAFFNSFYI